MGDIKFIYEGILFNKININPVTFIPDFFNLQIELESEVFYEIRKNNNILPYKLSDSSEIELNNIKDFFIKHKSSLFFLFNDNELIGSILIIQNIIQSLSVAKKFQRNGYGTKLVKFAVNFILNNGYSNIELYVLPGNIPAQELYLKLGFKIYK